MSSIRAKGQRRNLFVGGLLMALAWVLAPTRVIAKAEPPVSPSWQNLSGQNARFELC
jgi:hypothetical protein